MSAKSDDLTNQDVVGAAWTNSYAAIAGRGNIATENRKWWKEAVVYQIYPRSFMDSNGDGIGDLPGIISKLDYLKWLGVDVVWLSPIYESPNDDMGYDISNYQEIMRNFGTMQDFDKLLAELHKRSIKLVMDLVVNHTSDEHAWFKASRASKSGPYRDYYIWRQGKGSLSRDTEGAGADHPGVTMTASVDACVPLDAPNNWESFFSGPAWELDERTNEYYLHLFSVKQPDLNWENPLVRQRIFNMMRWWLDKGVDGFRMDVINAISKAPGLPDVPGGAPLAFAGDYFLNGPRVHEYLQEMHEKVLSHYDVMTVGETLSVTPEDAVKYVGFHRQELNMVFQFELMGIDSGPLSKWDVQPWQLTEFKRIMTRWQTELYGRGWNSLYLNNHDQPRLVSRFGNDGEYRVQSATMLATLLHTLSGTPFIYQGEEIGMTGIRLSNIEDYRDVETLNWYREQLAKGERSHSDIMAAIYAKGRDNSRTPMQWNTASNAGFTTGTPWLTVNPNYREINVEHELDNSASVLHYYRRLIHLRKAHPVIVYGDYTLIDPENQLTYCYVRRLGPSALVVLLNFTARKQTVHWPDNLRPAAFHSLICNYHSETGDEADPPSPIVDLRPYEAKVYLANDVEC